ncbi:appetite-regulating hormone [Microcaecilia unicolor]|uniref:Appetite-regulating hormone n=1 Tax=Microcaecilia unicolor TaxID=1415580 RepID=A0A6P7Y8C5_9AMPH|nr:appetite-regulating hormone [Microcaecilia unicolor]
MFPRVTVWSFLLVTLLWTEGTGAGSSFLSPADLQKPESKKPSRKVFPLQQQRRDSGGILGDDERQMENNEVTELQFNFPLELDVKIPKARYHEYIQTMQQVLEGMFAGYSQERHQEKE